MTDQPPDAHAAPPQGTDPTPSADAPTKAGWSDRMWSFSALVAVALVSVIIGGLGGAALVSVSEDGRQGRDHRFGPGQSRIHRDGELRRPGMMNQRQREQWKQWRKQQRRQWSQDGRPSPTRPMKPTPSS
jgi:hypothetical protein